MNIEEKITQKVKEYLLSNPPTSSQCTLIRGIAVTWWKTSTEKLETILSEKFGHVKLLLGPFDPQEKTTTTFWYCSETARLSNIPAQKYFDISGSCNHISGGFYLKSQMVKLDIKKFELENSKIYWNWIFQYGSNSGYFVAPICMMEDKVILYHPSKELKEEKKSRKLKSVQSGDKKFFSHSEDKLLEGQKASLSQLKEFCKNNSIHHDSIYARIGGYAPAACAFKVETQEDVEYAIEISKTEGYLCWVCACKASSDEFDKFDRFDY